MCTLLCACRAEPTRATQPTVFPPHSHPSLQVPEKNNLPQITCEQGSQRRVRPYTHILQVTGHVILQAVSRSCPSEVRLPCSHLYTGLVDSMFHPTLQICFLCRRVCGVLCRICTCWSSAKTKAHTEIIQTKIPLLRPCSLEGTVRAETTLRFRVPAIPARFANVGLRRLQNDMQDMYPHLYVDVPSLVFILQGRCF